MLTFIFRPQTATSVAAVPRSVMRVLGPIGPASPASRSAIELSPPGEGAGRRHRRGDQVVLVEREGPHLQCQLDRAVGLDPKRDRGVGLDELGDQLQRAVAVEVLGGHADAHAVVPHLEGEAAMVHADRDLHLRRLEVATVDGDLQARALPSSCSPPTAPPAPESPPAQRFRAGCEACSWRPDRHPEITSSLLGLGLVSMYVTAPAPTATAPTAVQNHHF